MKMPRSILAAVFFLLLATQASAIAPVRKVVTLQPAMFECDNGVRWTVEPGTVFEVWQRKGRRLQVGYDVLGWIDADKVTSYELCPVVFSRVIESYPKQASLLLARGAFYRAATLSKLAEDDFSAAIALDPTSARAMHCRAMLRHDDHNLEDAIEDYDEAIRLDPKRMTAWMDRATARIDQYLDAIAPPAEPVPAEAVPASMSAGAGACACGTGKLCGTGKRSLPVLNRQQSLAMRHWIHWQTALASATHEWSSLASASQFVVQTGDEKPPPPRLEPSLVPRKATKLLKLAMEDFEKAIELAPRDPRPLLARAQSHVAVEDYDKGLADFDLVLKLLPTHSGALAARGEMWLRTGKYEQARDDFKRAVEAHPNNPDAHNVLAWLLATCPLDRLRDGASAIAHATQACELTEWADYALIDTLAAGYAEAGNFKKAIELANKALEIAPESEHEKLKETIGQYERGEPLREGAVSD